MRLTLAAIVACWLAIVLGAITTRMPYVDEGFYSLAAHNRITRGNWGAPEIEPSAFVYANMDKPLTRIDRRAYWIMPLEPIIQASWYSIVGFGLVQHRLVGVIGGILALLIWFDLVRRISQDTQLAWFAALLIAFDYSYITAACMGRMDMLGSLFGLGALYAHERFISQRPLLARSLSATLLCAAAMIHPVAFAVWLVVYGARCLMPPRQVTLAQVGAFAAPVLVTAALFALWISFDVQAFRDQVLAQSGFRATIALDEARRYVAIYGLNMNWASGDVLRTLPALTFLGAAAYLLIRWRQSLRSVGLREVLLLGTTALVALTFSDNRKWPYFGVHTVPWLAVISAYALRALWNSRAQIAVVGWLCLYVLAPVLAGAYVVQRRSNDRIYRPAVAALESVSGNGQMVFAPAEFLFAYQGPFIFDERLGFLSGRSVPGFAVSKEDLEQELTWSREGNPRLYAHVQSMLNKSCTMRFENQKYAVYACGSAGTSPR